MITNIIGFYLIGSLVAFMMVFDMYNDDYDSLKTVKEIIDNNPEAKIIFVVASLFSWVYVLFFGIAKLKNHIKK